MKLSIPVTAFVVAATCLSVIAAAAPPKTQPKTQPKAGATRTEHDLLGDKQVPANAYYGVQALRGMENFQLSGVAINHYPGFVEAWAIVKLAAARANTQVGAMKPERLAMIEKACKAIMDGKYHDQFLVDWYQGGAGTSTNMCANEVIANVGLELGGHKKGEYQFLEPHDDLNMSQSTNDSYPTAIKVALIMRNDKLCAELEQLSASYKKKGAEYLTIVKMGTENEAQHAYRMARTRWAEFEGSRCVEVRDLTFVREEAPYNWVDLATVPLGAQRVTSGTNSRRRP